jgi:cell division protein FtsB
LLALVLVVLLVSYAYPLRSWYDQRAERNDLQREASELRQSVADLEAELELWDDPAYVAAQARDRLGFVLPDEDGFVVVPPDDSADAETDDGVEDVAEPEQGTLPGVPGSADMAWYERLWGSVEAADVPVLETDR